MKMARNENLQLMEDFDNIVCQEVQWLRPNEIYLESSLFPKLASSALLHLPAIKPSRFLDDLWLLNAIGALGVELTILDKIFPLEFAKYYELGLYTVIISLPGVGKTAILIDDKLPCYETNDADVLLFSECVGS